MHVAVVGSGYVGLVAGACLADLGHEVILVDNDPEKLKALRKAGYRSMKIFCPNSGPPSWAPAHFFRRFERSRPPQLDDFHCRGHSAYR